METAKDKKEFVRGVAEYLSMGEEVRFDPGTLRYGVAHQHEIEEYADYLDMPMLPEDIEGELRTWQIDVINDLRDILDLPCSIDPPMKSMQIDWMVDFANQKSLGCGFVRDVERALHGRHPFRDFKTTIYRWGIEKEWFAYQQQCYEEYVYHELSDLL